MFQALKAKADIQLSGVDQYLQYVGGTAGVVTLAGVTAASLVYFATRPKGTKPRVPLDEQSETHTKGHEIIRTSRFTKEAREGKFMRYLYEDCQTLYEVLKRGARESNNGKCLGFRERDSKTYTWISYDEVLLRARNFGSGLLTLGLKPGASTFIGLYAQNSPEWVISEHGIYTYSMVIIPLYDTLGPDACAYIIKQAEISAVICDDDAKIALLLHDPPSCLKRLICISDIKLETSNKAKQKGIEVIRFEEVEKLGSQRKGNDMPPKPSDLCTICYTSGTTGNPKGVMLSHENVISDVSAVMFQLGEQMPQKTDVLISFLPLAHMFERCCEASVLMVGGAIGFYSGDIRRLNEDMKLLAPTLMPAVPRLLNRIYDKMLSNVNGSAVKKIIFNAAVKSKMSELRRGVVRNNSIWDLLVFRPIQQGLGGNLRLMVVGSAPLAANVLTLIRCAAGCVVVEGYGQTECVSPCTMTIQGDSTPDHVGPPLSCCAIKLDDVPEMEYYASAGQGEICIKGTNVFQGYFKEPEKTREAIDKDGWLHTGDVGKWLPNGTLRIIDRKKNIFKLSQGEYIAPEKIEHIYQRSDYVNQVYVHGESLKSCTVAVIVPEVEAVKRWAAHQQIPGTLSVLCADDRIRDLIMNDITQLGKTGGLKSFEQVKDIYLHPDPFSVQNGLLTPTMKSKRQDLRAYFKPQIEDMYAKL